MCVNNKECGAGGNKTGRTRSEGLGAKYVFGKMWLQFVCVERLLLCDDRRLRYIGNKAAVSRAGSSECVFFCLCVCLFLQKHRNYS